MTLFTVKPSQLVKVVERTLLRGLVPYVTGSPGVGKSDIFRQIATKYRLKMIDVRLSQIMPEDLNGLPFRNGNKAAYLPFENFPIEGDEIPEGYDGWFIMLDEMSSANKSVQAAAYKLILDRMVGIHNLHPKVVMAAAGNKQSDKAVVVSQSTALQSRLIHYELIVDELDWMKWAEANEQDFRVKAFINYKPTALHRFDPNHQDKTFPCPRTWSFVSRLIVGTQELDDLDRINIVGAVGDGHGAEFYEFCQISDNAPKMEDIIKDPENTKIPTEVSLKFFVTSALMEHTTTENIDKVFIYMNRLAEEFQVIFLRGMAIRNPKLRAHPVYAKNVTKLLRFLHDENDDYVATPK